MTPVVMAYTQGLKEGSDRRNTSDLEDRQILEASQAGQAMAALMFSIPSIRSNEEAGGKVHCWNVCRNITL